jgi:hypothetical protein
MREKLEHNEEFQGKTKIYILCSAEIIIVQTFGLNIGTVGKKIHKNLLRQVIHNSKQYHLWKTQK